MEAKTTMIGQVVTEWRDLLARDADSLSLQDRRRCKELEADFLRQVLKLLNPYAGRLARSTHASRNDLLQVGCQEAVRLFRERKLDLGFESSAVVRNGRRNMQRAANAARGLSANLASAAMKITAAEDEALNLRRPEPTDIELAERLRARPTKEDRHQAAKILRRHQLHRVLDPEGKRTEAEMSDEIAKRLVQIRSLRTVRAALLGRAGAISTDADEHPIVLATSSEFSVEDDWRTLYGARRLARTLHGLSAQPSAAAEALAVIAAVLGETPGEAGLRRLAGRPTAPFDVVLATIPADDRPRAATAIQRYLDQSAASAAAAAAAELQEVGTQPALHLWDSDPVTGRYDEDAAEAAPVRPLRPRVRRARPEQLAGFDELLEVVAVRAA